MSERKATLHLVAFCTDAVSYNRAEIRFCIAYKNADDEWEDHFGNIVIPFWTIPFDKPQVEIPEGWIEHIHELAMKHAAQRRAPQLTQLLPAEPVYRRF